MVDVSYHQVLGPGICCQNRISDAASWEMATPDRFQDEQEAVLQEPAQDQGSLIAAVQSSIWANDAEIEDESDDEVEVKVISSSQASHLDLAVS